MSGEDVTVALKDVTVRKSGVTLLRQVSLDFVRGKISVVMGPNGAGKSPLLRSILGITELAGGSIRIFQRDRSEWSRQALAKRVALVPQAIPNLEGFTVRDVIALGRAPYQGMWMLDSEADHQVITQCINQLQLAPMASRAYDSLSGGEKRRVMLAQALAQSRELLLLDEPEAGLDMFHTYQFFDLLNDVKQTGATIVCILHDIALASQVADHLFLLSHGALKASGSAADVIDSGAFEEVFRIGLGKHAMQKGVVCFPVRPN